MLLPYRWRSPTICARRLKRKRCAVQRPALRARRPRSREYFDKHPNTRIQLEDIRWKASSATLPLHHPRMLAARIATIFRTTTSSSASISTATCVRTARGLGLLARFSCGVHKT